MPDDLHLGKAEIQPDLKDLVQRIEDLERICGYLIKRATDDRGQMFRTAGGDPPFSVGTTRGELRRRHQPEQVEEPGLPKRRTRLRDIPDPDLTGKAP